MTFPNSSSRSTIRSTHPEKCRDYSLSRAFKSARFSIDFAVLARWPLSLCGLHRKQPPLRGRLRL